MQIRFLLGPAGSGKTYRCLAEIRRALNASPAGASLVFVAPKQATYQLERQLLEDTSLAGYTRLRILSFERLADFVFEACRRKAPEILDEEGRIMVLRGLLAQKRERLKLFRASARLTGFARQLSQALSELQRDQLTPESLRQLARQMRESDSLAYKLEDLASLLEDYLNWLKGHQLQDTDSLLSAAAQALRGNGEGEGSRGEVAESADVLPLLAAPRRQSVSSASAALHIESLWLDGFAEFSQQELDLLSAVLPFCKRATLALCLDQVPPKASSWLSSWSLIQRTFERCRQRLAAIPGADLAYEVLAREPGPRRFSRNPVLQHLEQFWTEPRPYKPAFSPNEREPNLPGIEPEVSEITPHLRLVACADPEAEAVLAAREILGHVRPGGRYRDVAVLVRSLENYHQVLQRVFSRYEIPCFIDRRESVSHHPFAELTRSTLRTIAFGWAHEDWFAALKTGLVPAADYEIDWLENEALARGWKGAAWQKPLAIEGDDQLNRRLSNLQQRLMPPFQRLALALGLQRNHPAGRHLASALRAFWQELHIEQRLNTWAGAEIPGGNSHRSASVHATVWDELNSWLANLELAFPNEALSLREWLPILEAGLANLSVGIIPPALDQVLVGAIDRSRNADLNLTLVLGMNEGLFPAPPAAPLLLTDTDRLELEKSNVLVGSSSRQQLGRERFFAYIACTRPRQRLVVSYALHDARGVALNPSLFVGRLRQLFPTLAVETPKRVSSWDSAEHLCELVAPMLKKGKQETEDGRPKAEGRKQKAEDNKPEVKEQEKGLGNWTIPPFLFSLPPVAALLERLSGFQNPELEESLAPEWAARLYGPLLRTSVSRLEQFAACPFKFFVHSGLRAQERELFELDVREQGTFQHDVLALFHEQLKEEGQRWRDITPAQARERVAAAAKALTAGYRGGLLEASEQTRFLARSLVRSLQEFVATLVDWMRKQYRFDPVAVEIPYGEAENAPAWTLQLGNGNQLELRGRIDRVDLCRVADAAEAFCVVVDYKSSQKQLDPVLLANGVQLQLLAYLNVLRHWPNPDKSFGVPRLVPAGVFYVNLRGRAQPASNRMDALSETDGARKLACRHTGRFDARVLRQLDARPDAKQGDQFNYRLANDGQLFKNSTEALNTAEFIALLDRVESTVKNLGQQVYAGRANVSPFRKGSLIACHHCDYQTICRLDPWTQKYRVLRKEPA